VITPSWLIVAVIVYEPSLAKVWMPLTVKMPLLKPLVPVVPPVLSPHAMLAG